jgi:hypothetical protein
MTERQKILDKIRKLLALATSSNQHEAEAAMAKASELMQEHQIDEAEASLKQAEQEEVLKEYWQVPNLKMKYIWVVILAQAAGKLYDVEVLNPRSLHGTQILWIGYKGDIEAAKITLEHLFHSWANFVENDLTAEKKRARDWGYPWPPRATMKFKLGHGQGYAAALRARAYKLAADRKANVSASGATGTALVVVKNQLIEKVYDKARGGPTSRQQTGMASGYDAGRHRGQNVALGGGIRGASIKALK